MFLSLINKVISPSLTDFEMEFSSLNTVKLWHCTTFNHSVKLNLSRSLARAKNILGVHWHQHHWCCPIFVPSTVEVTSTIIRRFWQYDNFFEKHHTWGMYSGQETCPCPLVSCCSLRISTKAAKCLPRLYKSLTLITFSFLSYQFCS